MRPRAGLTQIDSKNFESEFYLDSLRARVPKTDSKLAIIYPFSAKNCPTAMIDDVISEFRNPRTAGCLDTNGLEMKFCLRVSRIKTSIRPGIVLNYPKDEECDRGSV